MSIFFSDIWELYNPAQHDDYSRIAYILIQFEDKVDKKNNFIFQVDLDLQEMNENFSIVLNVVNNTCKFLVDLESQQFDITEYGAIIEHLEVIRTSYTIP